MNNVKKHDETITSLGIEQINQVLNALTDMSERDIAFILDALNLHEQGKIALIPTKPNSKAPKLNQWTTITSPINDIYYHIVNRLGGLGIRIQTFEGKIKLVVLDFDGKKSKVDVENNTTVDKDYSRLDLYKMFHKEFKDECLIIKTASTNGNQAIFLVDESEYELDRDNHPLNFKYPYDYAAEGLRNEPIDGSIERFCDDRKKQVCTVSTKINGNSYHVSPDSKFDKISDIPIIDAKDFQLRTEKVMLLNRFTTYIPASESKDIEKETNVGFVRNSKRHDVPNYLIEKEAEEVLMWLKANDGSKHDIYLALGNFYANMARISKESAIKIHEKILEKAPTLFKNNADALKTLFKGYNNNDNDKKQTGARHIYDEYASHLESAQEFWIKRFKYTHNITKYHPNGQTGKKYDCIVENPYTKQIELHKIRVKSNKDGSFEDYTDEVKPVLGLEIVDIERIQNSIVPSANDTFRFSYIASGRMNIQTIEGSTLKEIQDKLRSQIGLVLSSSFGYVFNQIVAFYTRNNLIKVSKTAPVAGIFEIDGVLRRFDYNLNEIKPTYDKQKLINALDLLEQIRDILPTDDNKFGAIIADGLLLPFSFVLKQHGNQIRYQILLGAGKTGKSSIGELEVNLYNPTRINSVSGNIFNAGQFASEWQVGTKFGISSYVVCINEVAKAFNDENIVEILKSAIETPIARATNDGTYYSYSSLIMTSNVDLPQTDAMVRRSSTYYFTPAERLSEDDIDALADLLNVSGTNSRFTELAPIGDFVFTFLHNNMDLFDTLNTDELKIRVIEEIEKETGKNLDWCKQDVKEDNKVVIDELDADTLAEFTQEVKNIYNNSFRNYSNYDYNDDDGMYYKTLPFLDTKLISLISRGAIPFLAFDNKNDKIFIVGHRVKDFFAKRHQKIVTNKQLAEEFEIFNKQYEVEEGRMTVDGKYHRGLKCDVELIVDLLNNEIDIDNDDNDDNNNDVWTPEEEEELQRLLAKKEASK